MGWVKEGGRKGKSVMYGGRFDDEIISEQCFGHCRWVVVWMGGGGGKMVGVAEWWVRMSGGCG